MAYLSRVQYIFLNTNVTPALSNGKMVASNFPLYREHWFYETSDNRNIFLRPNSWYLKCKTSQNGTAIWRTDGPCRNIIHSSVDTGLSLYFANHAWKLWTTGVLQRRHGYYKHDGMCLPDDITFEPSSMMGQEKQRNINTIERIVPAKLPP